MPERVPLRPWLSLLPYLISTLALSFPSHSPLLRLSLFLLTLALTTHILTSTALPLASLNFSQGAALAAHVFAASDIVLLSDVRAELRRAGQTKGWRAMGGWERVRWAASLVTSPRLIGWSSTSTSTSTSPSPPLSTSPTSFILRQSLHLLLEILTLLALLTLAPSLPHLSAAGPALASAPYPLRLLYTSLLGLAMYASIDAPHKIWVLALLCVGNPVIRVYNRLHPTEREERGGMIEVWKPADFPPLFGKWGDAYTLRRFWGRTWQQTHRRKFKSHSRFVKSLIFPPLSTSKTLSRLIDLYTAFLISGLMHAAGEYMMLSSQKKQGARTGVGMNVGGSIRFFMLQAVGVHAESLILSVFGRRIAPTPIAARNEEDGASAPASAATPTSAPTSTPTEQVTRPPPPPPPYLTKILKILRILGYIWVWQWFAHTTPVLFDPLVKAGFVDDLRDVLRRGVGRVGVEYLSG